ncbi:MAG TPA: hypothetical protein VJT54_13995 [Verrucomicrobiae bacterium]|nr:hypothetical protein [Verrucomicrobiae bacterium]
MNEKLNLPEEIMFGPAYSLRANLKANTWAFVAMLLSLAGDVWLAQPDDWGVFPKVIIAMVPVLISLFWVRSFVRWVRGMDELHRRISVEACLFATVVTLFVVTAWHLLDQAGFFQPGILPGRLHLVSHFHTASFPISLVLGFYFIGYAIFKRRYQ